MKKGVLILISSLLLSACGGGGGSSPAANQNNPDTPLIQGFDFTLAENDFWLYRWDYSYSSSSGGAGDEEGVFKVVLGAQTNIGNKQAWPITVTGKTGPVSESALSFAPRYSHIALENNVMYGFENNTWHTVFDADSGFWADGGFFFTGNDVLVQATETPTYLFSSFAYREAYESLKSKDQSKCEYFPNIGTICGDTGDSFIISEREYFAPSVGPVGYYYVYDSRNCGSSCAFITREYNVGLAASSFDGHAAPEIQEDDSSNNTEATAPTVTLPALISGTVDQNNTSLESYTATFNNAPVSVDVEDVFKFTLTEEKNVYIGLHFDSNTPADLDFVISQFGSKTALTNGYASSDNVAAGTFYEAWPDKSIDADELPGKLPAGTYSIGIDAYDTGNAEVNYKLLIYTY